MRLLVKPGKIAAFGTAFVLLSSLPSKATELDAASSQAVVVLTDQWKSSAGEMATFARKDGRWEIQRKKIPVTVGHNGMGWGVGIHPHVLPGPQKREGDHRAPAGVFLLEFGFGAIAYRERTFPYRQVFDRDRWVDDPASRFYNQWVQLRNPQFPLDWSSAEIMRRSDGLYDYVIVVGHNRNPIIPGRGSAIFLHSWKAPGRSTIGCTAMEKDEVKRLLQWLDLSARPVLIQIPKQTLEALDISISLRRRIEECVSDQNQDEL